MSVVRWMFGAGLALLAGVQNPVPEAQLEPAGEAGAEAQVRTLPACTSLDGEAVDWQAFEGRALVIYFHRPGLEYAQRGLRELIDLFAADHGYAMSAGLVVVGFAEEGMDVAALEADVPGLLTTVVVDPGHKAFVDFRAVAFPTAYVLDTERREIHVSRGFGPHFSARVGFALRRATGAIDDAEYQELMEGGADPELGPEQRRLLRACGLARAMARAGEARTALGLVRDALLAVERPDAGALELVVRLQLLEQDADGAQRALEVLATAYPDAEVLPLLRCRMHLDAGEIDAAEQELAGARARRHPEVHLLRGRIHEARGEFVEAAAVYRERLEQLALER